MRQTERSGTARRAATTARNVPQQPDNFIIDILYRPRRTSGPGHRYGTHARRLYVGLVNSHRILAKDCPGVLAFWRGPGQTGLGDTWRRTRSGQPAAPGAQPAKRGQTGPRGRFLIGHCKSIRKISTRWRMRGGNWALYNAVYKIAHRSFELS